ncbi:595_t:CDS:2, partial [Funneliformis caledonium]
MYNNYRWSSLKETSSNETLRRAQLREIVQLQAKQQALLPRQGRFRNLWWIDGNIHLSANWDEAFDVDWEKYSVRTDMYNVHGSAIEREITFADPQRMLTSTKASNKKKEPDGSFLPFDKPDLNSNGREGPNS